MMKIRRHLATLLLAGLSSTAAAETVPLADLMLDARVEAGGSIEIDLTNPGPRAEGLEFEAESGFAWGRGTESRLEVKPTAGRGVLELTGRPFIHRGSRVQSVRLALDGEVFRTIVLVPWKHTYRVRIPERLLEGSVARLTMAYRWTARPSEVLGGSEDTRNLAVAWSSLRIEHDDPSTSTTLDADGSDIVLRGGGRIRLPLRTSGPTTVAAEGVEIKATPGMRGRLEGGGMIDEVVWTEESVDRLSVGEAGIGVHLQLTLQAEPRSWWNRLVFLGRPPEVRLRGTAIEAQEVSWPSRDLARMGYYSQADEKSTAAPELIILWVVDTLRADHLGLYGYGRNTSPRLDAFAERSVSFDRVVAQSAWTRPSVTSILTGQLLRRHGVYDKDDALAREATTLAELLHPAGYDTAAFITNGNLRHVGLEQGFRTFRHFKEGGAPPFPFHRPAGEVAQAAIDFLDGAQLPSFLYLHVTDPHMPYEPLPEFAELWPVDDPSVGTIDGYRETINSPEPAVQELIDLYDAEIRQADAGFGALLDYLEYRGLLEETLIVFTADHGEAFFDHGDWQHGKSLYPEQIAVPLVIHWPQGGSPVAPGSRVEALGAHVDLAPTILRTVGLTPPATMQGRDLAQAGSRPTLAELRDSHRASVDERYKLVTNPGGELLGLYDGIDDQQELQDLTLLRPAVLEYHRRLHALFLERSGGGPGAATAEQDEETLEQLRALGYIQ